MLHGSIIGKKKKILNNFKINCIYFLKKNLKKGRIMPGDKNYL